MPSQEKPKGPVPGDFFEKRLPTSRNNGKKAGLLPYYWGNQDYNLFYILNLFQIQNYDLQTHLLTRVKSCDASAIAHLKLTTGWDPLGKIWRAVWNNVILFASFNLCRQCWMCDRGWFMVACGILLGHVLHWDITCLYCIVTDVAHLLVETRQERLRGG